MAAWQRLVNLFRRKRVDHEIEEEIATHLAMCSDDNIAHGMTPEAARRAARLRFGNPAAAKERMAEADTALGLDRLWFDVRYAARQLRKTPGFTITAMLTLAVGIGTNTAIFSSLDAVVLRPLAVPALNRVMTVHERVGASDVQTTLANYADWARQSRSFEELSVRTTAQKTLTGSGDATAVETALTSANFFRALRVEAIEGRLYRNDECQAGRNSVAVLNYGFWKRHFGADPAVLGRTVELDRRVYTIIGVLPKSVQYPSTADMFLPLAPTAAEWADRKAHSYDVMGRLRDGATVQQANAEMGTIAVRLARAYPETNQGWSARVSPLLDGINGDLTPLYYWMIMAATLFVLLVVCANVANLAFARGIARRPEIAMRAALGAGRWRIARQLLVENVLLALIGSVAGLAFAALYLRITLVTMPERVARFLAGWSQISLNGRAFVFSLTLAVVAGIVSGLAPVADALRVNLAEQLKAGSRATTGNAHGQRLRSLFAIAQVALAVALVIGASLVTKGMWSMLHKGDIYHPERVLTFNVTLPKARYAAPRQQAEWYAESLARLRALPGVQYAEVTGALPYDDNAWLEEVAVENRPTMPGKPQTALHLTVSSGYFAQLGIPIVAGRGFTSDDTLDTTPVAIVSERFAQQYFAGANPVGQHIRMGDTQSPEPWLRIVGVAKETNYGLWDAVPRAAVYLNALQHPEIGTEYAITTAGDPLALAPAARRALAAVDPALPLNTVETYERLLKDNLTGLMYAAAMLGIDAAIALLLAAIGIFGVMAALVGERTREIGVRLAMGARREDVLRMVLGRAGRLTSIGLAAGLLLAFGLAHGMANLLRGVRPDDPTVFVGIAVTIAAVAAAASWIPARRAARVNPMQAMRSE